MKKASFRDYDIPAIGQPSARQQHHKKAEGKSALNAAPADAINASVSHLLPSSSVQQQGGGSNHVQQGLKKRFKSAFLKRQGTFDLGLRHSYLIFLDTNTGSYPLFSI